MCRAFGELDYISRITTSNIIAFNRFHARNSSKCNTSQRWRFKHKIFHVCIPSFYANEWVQSMASTFKTKCTIHTHTRAHERTHVLTCFSFYQKNLCTEWCRMPNTELFIHATHSTYSHSFAHMHIYIHSNRIFKTLSWNDFKLNGINAGTMFEYKIFHRDPIDAYTCSLQLYSALLALRARDNSFLHAQIPFSKSNLFIRVSLALRMALLPKG